MMSELEGDKLEKIAYIDHQCKIKEELVSLPKTYRLQNEQ